MALIDVYMSVSDIGREVLPVAEVPLCEVKEILAVAKILVVFTHKLVIVRLQICNQFLII